LEKRERKLNVQNYIRCKCQKIIGDVSKAYGIEGYHFTDEEVEVFRRYLDKIFGDKQIFKIIMSKMY
jgi:hypothetical protein